MQRTIYRSFVFLTVVLFSSLTYGQSANTAINFSYKTPDVKTKNGVNKAHYTLLGQNIKGSYKQRGKIEEGNNFLSTQTPFEIVPSITVVDVKNAGDIETAKVVKVVLRLSIKDAASEMLFNQYKKTVIATDKNLQKAIAKALNEIKTSDPKLKSLFTEAEANILTHYKKNCAKILKSANTHVERKEYNKAYGLLKYVPENMSCFADVERLITKIYVENIENNCKKMMLQARIAEAEEDYAMTLYHLGFIDPSSSCYNEALKLIKDVKAQKDKDDLKAFIITFDEGTLRFSKMSDLEKIRILEAQARILKLDFI